MAEADVVSTLVQRLRAGDAGVVEELYSRYAQKLCRLARQRLDRRVAARVDGEDVVQSVFRTFFRRSVGGGIQIDSTTHVWRLLLRITLLKTQAKGRYHKAALRDVRAETDEDGWWQSIGAREPGPAEAAALLDQLESLLRGLPAVFGDVLKRRLEGCAVAEIAQELGLSRQTVYRFLKVLQERLAASLSTGE